MRETFRKLPEAKKKMIIEAAVGVFAENGYHRASIADICKRAKISNGALYKYFEGKEDLYECVYDHVAEMIFSTVFDHDYSASGILDTVKRITRHSLDFVVGNPNQWAVYMDIASSSMNDFSSKLSLGLEKRVKKFWVGQIRTAKERGEIPQDINESSAAYVIDNNILMFVFSLISEHYRHRLECYFGDADGKVNDSQKISVVSDAVERYLSQIE